MPRVKNLLITALCLIALAAPAAAQRRRAAAPEKPAPASNTPAVAETPSEPQSPARAITVSLKDGSDVKGEYLGADRSAFYVRVAGNRLTLKLDDVAAVYFGERPAPQAPAPPAEAQTTLALEAGIIYKMGGNQPVARTEFLLLDQSLETILLGAGMSPGRTGVLSEYAFSRKYPSQYPGVAARVAEIVRPHTVARVETDFSGKAQFTGLKPGTYYLHGLISTRGGFAVWNLPVEVKAGQNSVFLDQNNAATAF